MGRQHFLDDDYIPEFDNYELKDLDTYFDLEEYEDLEEDDDIEEEFDEDLEFEDIDE